MINKINFAFFGSSRLSVIVLDELEHADYVPSCIVTTPDKPKGRKLILTETPVKTWAKKRNIPVLDPVKLDSTFIQSLNLQSKENEWDLFVVASYGKIIPKTVFDIPTHKTLNIHPSLLPKYRGASPLQSAILDDAKETGVTIMRIDEQMDHGPIIAQKSIHIIDWPVYEKFEEDIAREGARLLREIIPDWIARNIEEKVQIHEDATLTKKISKEDALINLSDDAYTNFRKIQAFHEWPIAYFLHKHHGKEIRVKITDASFANGKLTILKVIPEGGKEISFEDFERGYGKIVGTDSL